MAPLVLYLEQANGEKFTLKGAISMIQVVLVLLGDTAHHQFSLRRKELMKNLNLQLQSLMKDSDFKDAQPFLLGKDFGKTRLEDVAALNRTVYAHPSSSKLKFRPNHPCKNNWGHQDGKPHHGPRKVRDSQAVTKTNN